MLYKTVIERGVWGKEYFISINYSGLYTEMKFINMQLGSPSESHNVLLFCQMMKNFNIIQQEEYHETTHWDDCFYIKNNFNSNLIFLIPTFTKLLKLHGHLPYVPQRIEVLLSTLRTLYNLEQNNLRVSAICSVVYH